MNGDGHRQRAVMASDAEWERAGVLARQHGMDRSRYLIHRALIARCDTGRGAAPRGARAAGAVASGGEAAARGRARGRAWEDACDAVDGWIDRERTLAGVTDPGRGEPLEGAGWGPGRGRLRGAGRGVIADPKRPRSLSLDAAERKAVRDAAAAAGKPISQYVLDLVAADGSRTATRWC